MCRLLDDGGGGDKTPPPPPLPCWCTAETDETLIASDPNSDTAAAAGTATTGYRCPPREALSQRRAAAATVGERPLRSRTATSSAQSNVQRSPQRLVSSRFAGAGDWCCDNRVDDDDDDDDYYYDYDDGEVRDDRNRVRVQMNHGPITCGGGAQSRVGGADAKPPAPVTAERTYASTEAQTDETACSSAYREQRRRERRERRQQQRRVHPPPPPPPALSSSALLPPPPPPAMQTSGTVSVGLDRLPDLLLSSPPPPPPPLYTTVDGVRTTNSQSLLPAAFQHPHHHQPPGTPVSPSAAAAAAAVANAGGGFRLPFGIIPGRRRRLVDL